MEPLLKQYNLINDSNISNINAPRENSFLNSPRIESELHDQQPIIFDDNIDDNNVEHENDENNILTKYYFWQTRIGELIFSGDVFHNDSLTEETGGTPISSLTANTKTGISSIIKLGRVRDINGLFLESLMSMISLKFSRLPNYKCYLNQLVINCYIY